MMVLISKLFKYSLEYWPKIIFCNDMQLRGSDGALIPYLNSFYDLLCQKTEINDSMKMIDIMSWCINNAFWKQAIQIYKQNGSCDFVHQNDLDVNYIIDRFKEHMKESSWNEFLQKENVEIVYDIENCKIP